MTDALGILAVVIVFAGLWALWCRAKKIQRFNKQEVATIIESFLNGTAGSRTWDDFISIPLTDPKLEEIRVRCARLPNEFPPEKAGMYCNEQGIAVLKTYVGRLKGQEKK